MQPLSTLWDSITPEARKRNPHLKPSDPAKLTKQFDQGCAKVADAKSERHMHEQFIGHLRRLGLEWFGHGSTAHKSKYTEGWPDFVIPLPNGRTLYWEFKFGNTYDLDENQRKCFVHLEAQGHSPRVIRSYNEAVAALAEELSASKISANENGGSSP